MTKARDNATQNAMVLINKTDYTGISSLSFNNVFSSTYENYIINFNHKSSAGTADAQIRLRSNGVDASGSTDYKYGHIYVRPNNSIASGVGPASFYLIVDYPGSTIQSAFQLRVFSPNLPKATHFSNEVSRAGDDISIWSVGRHVLETAYDGFTIFPQNGTLTGTLRIYGIKN